MNSRRLAELNDHPERATRMELMLGFAALMFLLGIASTLLVLIVIKTLEVCG